METVELVLWYDAMKGKLLALWVILRPHSSLWIIQLDSYVVSRMHSLLYSGIVLHEDMQVSTLHPCFHLEFHIPSFSEPLVVGRNTGSQMKFRAVSMSLFRLQRLSSTGLHSFRVSHGPASFCTLCKVTLGLLSPHSLYVRHVVTSSR